MPETAVESPTRFAEPMCVGICRGGTYGLFGEPDECVAPARGLGARLVRIFLYWAQLEPEPGRYDWTALDAFVDQLRDGDRAWITVAGSSPFGSRVATPFLPPSPATDRAAYRAFIRRMVRRSAGRVQFWQCEIEPCVPLMWAGSPQDYLEQLAIFSAAVRAEAPTATVVLGAAVPAAMLADAPGSDRRMLDGMRQITVTGAGLYDAFDIHPYGDPYLIDDLVASARSMMAEAGAQRPILAGEYAGPMPTAYRQNLPALRGVLAGYRQAFGDRQAQPVGLGPEADHPEMIKLYQEIDHLPATLRMFLRDGDPDLAQRRDLSVGNDMIIRTALLATAGVGVVAPFQLAPERTQESPYTLRALMFSAFALYDDSRPDAGPGGWIRSPRRTARTYAQVAEAFNGATGARRLEHGDDGLYVIEIDRPDHPVLVAWRRDDERTEIAVPTTSDTPGRVTVDAHPQLIVSAPHHSTDRSPSWTDVN
ncbi:alpha-amylase family protein [Microlunatus soli]|uniref:Beta-galactosidase n=1 Tax=Microlunatus soli TaxID=630515 RepID=A0A1H1NKS9_9ACTN|nr:beta-galactosidase [Microlunatus soli]SDR99483.1 Beta-galactosidase [Microlunatus soli]